MVSIAKLGVLPKLFLDLNDEVNVCPSCMLGTAYCTQWTKKGINQGIYSREKNNKP